MNATTYKAKIRSILKDSAIGRHVHRVRTGKLDTKSLKAFSTTGKCFKKMKEIGKKEYAITFLLDFSGSMDSYSDGKKRIDILTESLESTIKPIIDSGVSVEILGFNMTLHPFLLFGQKAKKTLWNKIASVGSHNTNGSAKAYYKSITLADGKRVKLVLPNNVGCTGSEGAGGYNFDGLATFQAVKRLSKQKGKKILFVFSDGEPTDDGHYAHWSDPTRATGDYSIEKSVKIAKANGIELLSVGIADSHVFDYYPRLNTRVIQNKGEMLAAIHNLLLKIIKR